MTNRIICQRRFDEAPGRLSRQADEVSEVRLRVPAAGAPWLPLPDEEEADLCEAFRGLDRRAAGRKW
jgi:hypothetical protein